MKLWQQLARYRRRRNKETAIGQARLIDTFSRRGRRSTKAGIRAEDTVEKLLALRSVRDQFADTGFDLSSSLGSQLKAMEARLVEHFVAERRIREGADQVTAAVVGDFNSGKSTFINALLKTDLCPTGDEPTTSSVTFFFHGDQERIEQLEPGGTRKRLSRDAYGALVRHRKQGDKVPAIFHISLPSTILEHVRIVDTPGFDAPPPNSNDTKVTERGVAESDVLFVLMDASKGNPSKTLLEQLQRLQQSRAGDRQKPMFLLLNKAEGLPPSQRARVSKENGEKYQALFRVVAPISAKLLMNQEVEEGLMSLPTLWSAMVQPVVKERHTIAEHQFQRNSTQIRDDLVRMTAWLSDTIKRNDSLVFFDEKRALEKIDEGFEVILEHMSEMCADANAFVTIERKEDRFWSSGKIFFRTKFRRQHSAISKHSSWTEIGKALEAILDELAGLGIGPLSSADPRYNYKEIQGEFLSEIKSTEDEIVKKMKTSDDWNWSEEERCWEDDETEDEDTQRHWMERQMLDYKCSLTIVVVESAYSLRESLREAVVSFAASNRAQSEHRDMEQQLLRERIGILREGLE